MQQMTRALCIHSAGLSTGSWVMATAGLHLCSDAWHHYHHSLRRQSVKPFALFICQSDSVKQSVQSAIEIPFSHTINRW